VGGFRGGDRPTIGTDDDGGAEIYPLYGTLFFFVFHAIYNERCTTFFISVD
jgi:hypothetical protein